MLEHREKVTGETAVLVDNGDMWTGQTEATMLKGKPVVEIYNRLGFAAANVANHEFDFGVNELEARAAEAKFPFLGANIYRKGTEERPAYVKPWTIVTRNGVKVGVIGLSYIDTPRTTLAKNVADLEFRGYADTLRAELPELRESGAEVIVVLLHDEVGRAEAVFSANPDLKVDLVVSGQNHRKERTEVNGIPIVNPGPFGRSYVRFDVILDAESRKVFRIDDETVNVSGLIAQPAFPQPKDVTDIVERASKAVESMASIGVGPLGASLARGTFNASPLGNFVVDCWLAAFPDADIAFLNHGALRQDLEAGPVTMGDLFSVLPFENNILAVRLTGAQVKSQLAIDHPVVGGLTYRYRERDGDRQILDVSDLRRPADRRSPNLHRVDHRLSLQRWRWVHVQRARPITDRQRHIVA